MRSRCLRVNFLAVVLGLGLVCAQGRSVRRAVGQEQGPETPGTEDGRKMPVFGKITALTDRSIQITNVDGENVSIKLTDKTEFRKDRQAAKRSDFKVGDIILVRGEENADHSWTAQVIAARSTNGPGGPGGGRGGFGGAGGRERGEFAQQVGTQGKDFVSGEIKTVDAPKLAVLRMDNVTQTMELNEDTSLRKGREAITMADIQPGDHVFARGGLENNVFVPKAVVIIGPEQWKRMQEWSGQGGGQRRRGAGGPGAGSVPAAGSADAGTGGANAQKPAEPQN
jgi:hypothetical protein